MTLVLNPKERFKLRALLIEASKACPFQDHDLRCAWIVGYLERAAIGKGSDEELRKAVQGS